MTIQEILKTMLRSYFIIAVGIMTSMAVFCSLFSPDATFGINVFYEILILAFMSVLPYMIFYSNKDIGKKQMLIRNILFNLILLMILFSFAYAWKWIEFGSIAQPIVYILLIMVVHLLVKVVAFRSEKRMADQLNQKLQRYKHE